MRSVGVLWQLCFNVTMNSAQMAVPVYSVANSLPETILTVVLYGDWWLQIYGNINISFSYRFIISYRWCRNFAGFWLAWFSDRNLNSRPTQLSGCYFLRRRHRYTVCIEKDFSKAAAVIWDRRCRIQELIRRWKLPNFSKITQIKGHFAVQGHSRSPIFVPIESSYTTSY